MNNCIRLIWRLRRKWQIRKCKNFKKKIWYKNEPSKYF